MARKLKIEKGFVITEFMVTLILLGLLFGVFMYACSRVFALAEYNQARKECISAAQAQLDSFSVTGEYLSIETAEELWPTVEFELREKPGQGRFEGLVLVEVRAECERRYHTAWIELARYVRQGGMR